MVIAKIHNVFKNLTETEQKIASYILEFPEKIVNMTAKELASACGTVPSAVNRMCKSIGVEGFAKLKISLATRVGQEGHNGNNIPFDKEDNSKMIFNKVFNSGINTLKAGFSSGNFISSTKDSYVGFPSASRINASKTALATFTSNPLSYHNTKGVYTYK